MINWVCDDDLPDFLNSDTNLRLTPQAGLILLVTAREGAAPQTLRLSIDFKQQIALAQTACNQTKVIFLEDMETWTRILKMKIGLIAAAIAVCATAATAQTLTVEGEGSATYTVLGVSDNANGYKDITTRREEGGSNIYSQHNVSCDPYLAGLAGSEPTLDLMTANLVSNPPLVEIIRESSEDAIAGHACGF